MAAAAFMISKKPEQFICPWHLRIGEMLVVAGLEGNQCGIAERLTLGSSVGSFGFGIQAFQLLLDLRDRSLFVRSTGMNERRGEMLKAFLTISSAHLSRRGSSTPHPKSKIRETCRYCRYLP